MGRQTAFHMLPEDASEFLAHARTRAPISPILWNSDSELIAECNVRNCVRPICLWDHDILPTLQRKYVTSAAKPYYRVDASLPGIELCVPPVTEWDGVPALIQGRIWGSFEVESKPFRKWFDSLVRFIHKTFVKNPVDWESGWVGRHAYEWHRRFAPTNLSAIDDG
jgi:hypothetical protein